MNLVKLISVTLFCLFFSCEKTIEQPDSSPPSSQGKSYSLDSDGNIVQTDIQISDFSSAEECMQCHEQHYEEWSSSFHANSFNDPIFMEMWVSERNHRPTTGVNFCIQCHAPAAFVSDWYEISNINQISDLESMDIPKIIKEGVSCDICHTMVEQSHSVFTQDNIAASALYQINPGEGVRYGSIEDPDTNSYHESTFLPMYESSFSCKPCHNQFIRGMPIEATISEWEDNAGLNMGGESCQDCHMQKQSDGHSSHYFAGVDLLFYDGVDNLSSQYQEVVNLLEGAVTINFSFVNGQSIDNIRIEEDVLYVPIVIQNLTGHKLPSGTPFSREAWLELIITTSLGDTLISKGMLDSSSDELNYYDEDLIFYTATMYDEEDQQGNVTYEASNALSYDDSTLGTLSSETKTYSIALNNININTNDEIFISARMLFRPFKPKMLEEFHPSSLENLPIIQMYSANASIVVP